MVVVDEEETSYTVVIVPPGFDRIFLHNPGVNNTFCADDINSEYKCGCRGCQTVLTQWYGGTKPVLGECNFNLLRICDVVI